MPEFLLRIERQPPGAAHGAAYRLSDLKLASRLSFFLWRSIPDEELIDLAAEGRLSAPDLLQAQVGRMLADGCATRFMNDFAGQWLQVREDRPIPELLRADYTYLNEHLARHYGMEDVYGSLLTITSYANRTSVVLRGKWVMENLLGTPPPAPPPNVPPLEENDGGAAIDATIDWADRTIDSPRAVFERLFGTSGSTDPAARLARMRKDRSVLDAVNEELSDLEREIGPGDQFKLDEYLSAVRDTERRIEMAERQNTRELLLVDQPIGTPSDYAEHAELMMDLLAFAYQTDLTRISSFMLAREVSVRAYPEIGVSDSHHPLSHHQDKRANLERLHRINECHFRQFGHLVKKLAATPEGDGTPLDSTLLLYMTGIS